MVELGRGKRRRTRGPPPRLAVPVTDVLGFDVLLECLSYLEVEDVNSACTTCTAWRDRIWKSSSIWEGIIMDDYNSHCDLPKGWCTSGREEYLRRVTLMKCQYAPARNLGTPVPLQRRTPGKDLMEKWKPDAIVFLVDVFVGRHEFDDDLPISAHKPVKPKKELGYMCNIYSEAIRVFSQEVTPKVTSEDSLEVAPEPVLFRLTDNEFNGHVEDEIPLDYLRETGAMEAINHFYAETFGDEDNDCFHDVGGLYVEMSYYVEGEKVPKCEPITLLSEHHSFFIDQDDGRITYRTDVEPAWLPCRQDWDDDESPFTKEEALRRAKVLNRHVSRYSSVPLPFDPEIEFRLSPPGENPDWEDAFEGDSKDVCSIRVDTDFCIGEERSDFAGVVVPTLLSLWNDAARQKERKTLQRFAR